MKNRRRHNGFSLIEVLFAMMVLTLGLIFVASQFPVGLMTSRNVTETTLHAIETHNAEARARLELGQMFQMQASSPPLGEYIGATANHFINNGAGVHYMRQPNVLVETFYGKVAIVMDDPSDTMFPFKGPDSDPDDYGKDGTANVNQIPPHIVGHFFDGPPTTSPGILAPENIGQIVIPQVCGYDRDVLIGMEKLGYTLPTDMPFNKNTNTYNDWQTVIRKIALERNYSQAMFYRLIGGRQCQVWIFTLSNTNKEVVYTMQDTSSFGGIDPQPYGPAADRRFPVPWKIQFDEPALNGFDRIELSYVTNNDQNIEGALLEIFRKDGYILDADRGYLYKILDVEVDNNGKNWVRLDRAIIEDLEYFWIFPPAIVERTTPYSFFADQQPVVNVTEATINF